MHRENAGSTASSVPRIAPGRREEIGFVNHAIARVVGLATGGRPPNIMTTLGRHRGLFRRWLRFASGLMPGGRLPRAESELAILRVAHNCQCAYEWHHHERLARTAGLSAEQVERVREGHAAPGWSRRHGLVLRTADELHADRTISDELWAQLGDAFSDVELIELCMLIGHYEMLAMTLNALRVQPDPLPAGPPSRAFRAVQALVERRAASGAGGS